MEIPLDVLVHNETLGVKGTRGRLLQISREGYYEVNLDFGGRIHRVLFPVASTVLIASSAEDAAAVSGLEVER
jgi:hypothetical protein